MKIYRKILIILLFSIMGGISLWYAINNNYLPITVTVELRNDTDDLCQLFYDTGDGFSSSKIYSESYKSDSNFQEIVFYLPSKRVKLIRIDPGYQSNTYEIKQISLKTENQIINYKGAEILSHFNLINLSPSNNNKPSTLVLDQHDSPDVQMILIKPISEAINQINSDKRNNLIWIIIISYLIAVLGIIFLGSHIIQALKKWGTFLIDTLSINDPFLNISNFLTKNAKLLFYSILIAVFSYGYELFNLTLSIDEELDSFMKASDYVYIIDIGRWGLFLLKNILLSQSVLPYFPTLIALICIALSSVIIISSEKNSRYSALVFSILFISSPLHSYYLAFNGAIYIAIGMLLVSISYRSYFSIWKNEKLDWLYFIISTVLLALAISIYQALLSFFVVLFAFNLFSYLFNERNIKTKVLIVYLVRITSVIVLGLILYKIGDITMKALYLNGSQINSGIYLDNFITWGKIPIKNTLIKLLNTTGAYLVGLGYYSKEIGLSIKSLFLVIPITGIILIKGKQCLRNKFILLFCLILLILSPFSIMYLTGMPLPARTFLGLPLMIAFLWWFTYKNVGNVLKKIILTLAILVFVNNTYINTRLFYSSYVSSNADRDMANRIIERIYELDPPTLDNKIKVAFIGSYQHPSNELFYSSDVHGASFFGWDNGNQDRILAFFKTIGINELERISQEEYSELYNSTYSIPSWPDISSVCLMDSVVIVKLSNSIKN